MTDLTAQRLLTDAGWVGPTTVRWDGPTIVEVVPATRSADVAVIAPGFVDLQVNGVDDVDCATADGDDWNRLGSLLAAQGVTAWCPTLVTMPLERYDTPLRSIRGAQQRGDADYLPTILGAHLEGPFLGGAPGAHPQRLIRDVDASFLDALDPVVRLVTLAPEQPSATAGTATLARRGIAVSMGHTTADHAQLDACAAAGATLVTHLFNGMSGLHHRTPGVAAWALTHSSISASLIADNVHVHPTMLRLAAQALGPDRLVLVTDAVAWRAGTAGMIGLALVDGAPRLADGTLAGSVVTMDQAVRNLVAAGASSEVALWAASRNPSRIVGHPGGTLAVGRPADLLGLTEDLRIDTVVLRGRPIAPPIAS